jgi:hypothetical protein
MHPLTITGKLQVVGEGRANLPLQRHNVPEDVLLEK